MTLALAAHTRSDDIRGILAMLVAMAVFVVNDTLVEIAAGHLSTGEIAVVAPFRYSIILWAILAGHLVWRESPDVASWVGIAIVTAAGLYTFLREQRLARAHPS
jgi:drug/metabolite transporter (DMT)-like permease